MWSSLLQNGTSACPGSLYIDFIGHIILDERETSLGTAALYTNCWLGNCWRTWVAMNCWLGMWPCYKRHMRMPPYFVSIECHKRRKTQYLGTFTLKYLYISKKNFLTPFWRGVSEGLRTWMKIRREFAGNAFYSRSSSHCFCAFSSLRPYMHKS